MPMVAEVPAVPAVRVLAGLRRAEAELGEEALDDLVSEIIELVALRVERARVTTPDGESLGLARAMLEGD